MRRSDTNLLRRSALWTAVVACIALPVCTSAQQSCDDIDPCTINDACQADGSCHGTAVAAGTPCTPFFTNGCTVSATCQQPFPGLSFCTPVEMAPDGTACTIPGLDLSYLGGCGTTACNSGFCLIKAVQGNGTPCNYPSADAFGACFIAATCESGACAPQLMQCPQGADMCTVNFCNPDTGGCDSESNTCLEQCATCDPSTGLCDLDPMPDDTECDDGSACTGADHCVSGNCVGTVGAVTPVPTPAVDCAGDCDGGGDVAVNELITLVNIALGAASSTVCPNGAPSGGEVDISLIISGVNNALNGCPV